MATAARLQKFYMAYYGRPADVTGLDYWLGITGSEANLVTNFGSTAQTEFVNLYGANPSTPSFVNAVFENLFGRQADAEGLQYWIGVFNDKVTAGQTADSVRADMVMWILDGAQADDAAIIAAKVTAAQAWTAALDTTPEIVAYDDVNNTEGQAVAREWLAAVVDSETAANQTDSSVLDAAIDQMINPSIPGDSYTLTAAANTFVGTRFNDTFYGVIDFDNNDDDGTATFTAADLIDGAEGSADLLDLRIDHSTASATTVQLTNVDNIEHFLIQNLSTKTVTFDFDYVEGETEVNNYRSPDALVLNKLADGTDLTITGNGISPNGATSANWVYDSGVNVYLNDGVQSSNLTLGTTSGTTAYTTSFNVYSDDSSNYIDTLNIQNAGYTSSVSLDSDSYLSVSSIAQNTTGSAYSVYVSGAGQTVINGFAGSGNNSINASSATGALTLGGVASSTLYVYGGSESDSLNVSAATGAIYVAAGNGSDVITATSNFTNADSIIGGSGTDTLVVTTASVADSTYTDLATKVVSGVETLRLSDALTGTVNLAYISSDINTVELYVAAGTNDGTLTFGGGDKTVVFSRTSSALDGALVVNAGGTANTDNLSIQSYSQGDTFNGNNVTATGYESLTINVSSNTSDSQDLGTVAINATTASTNVDFDLFSSGNSSRATTFTALTTNSTGLFTIDFSGASVLSTAAGITLSSTTSGTAGTQSITGSSGKDSITIGNFAATIDGGAGNDTIVGGSAADSILGGLGDDTITGAGGADTINGGSGADTLNYLLTADLFSSQASVDSIIGGDGVDRLLVGTSGTAFAVANNDSWARISGVETIESVSNSAAVTIRLDATAWDAGLRTVNISSGSSATGNVIDASEIVGGGMTLTGSTAGANAITGGAGADTITAGSANDTIVAGSGNDSITTGNGTNSVNAGSGVDTITGGTGNDTAVVSGTNEQVAGDVINLAGGSNAISIDNSTGAVSAEFDFDNISDVLSITVADANGGNGSTTQNVSVTFSAIAENTAQTVVLSASNITDTNDALLVTNNANSSTTKFSITGGAGNDSLVGSLGADTLVAGSGDDTVTGGSGNDSIYGGAGVDILSGGAGVDTFEFRAAQDSSSDSNNNFKDTVSDIEATDIMKLVLTNINNFSVNRDVRGGTNLYGVDTNNDDDSVDVGEIQITTTGVSLSDSQARAMTVVNVTGTAGVDTIVGGDNNDTIDGGSGNDIITGGAGNDSLTGGAGNDDFIFSASSTNGQDTVTDFTTNATAGGSDGDDLDIRLLITGSITADLDGVGADDGDLDTLDITTTNRATIVDNGVAKLLNESGTLAISDIAVAAADGKLVLADNAEAVLLVASATTSTSFNVYYIADIDSDATQSYSVTLVGTVSMTNSETFADVAVADLII